MEIKNVKGGFDFLPEDEKLRNYIKNTLINVFEKYGYEPIETPILTHLDLLLDKYDENNDLVKEVYRLKDQGNRDLGLRYDLTVPFAKFVAINKNNITMPFKRYEIAKVFRDGPVKVGRNREFTQCDVDVVGIKNQIVEAELLNLYLSAFSSLKIDVIIKYNSRNLIYGLILISGIDEMYVDKVLTVLDKSEKVKNEELIRMLSDLNISMDFINVLLKYLKMDMITLNNILKDNDNEYIKKGLNELSELYYYIKDTDLENVCKFTPTLIRGQNYYTGNVFEVYEKNLKVKGSIGGGGRYDKMITDFVGDNELYPTVGISFGLTSIYELLKDNKKESSNIDILIIPIDTYKESLNIANKLRKNEFKVLLEMNQKKLGKSLKFADKNGIKYTIVIGDDEVKNNIVNIKNMFNGDVASINIDELMNISLEKLNSKFK